MEILKWKVDGQKNNLTKNVVCTIFFWNYHCKNRWDKIMAETIMILKGDATHMIKEVSVYMLYRDGKKSKLLGMYLNKREAFLAVYLLYDVICRRRHNYYVVCAEADIGEEPTKINVDREKYSLEFLMENKDF